MKTRFLIVVIGVASVALCGCATLKNAAGKVLAVDEPADQPRTAMTTSQVPRAYHPGVPQANSQTSPAQAQQFASEDAAFYDRLYEPIVAPDRR